MAKIDEKKRQKIRTMKKDLSLLEKGERLPEARISFSEPEPDPGPDETVKDNEDKKLKEEELKEKEGLASSEEELKEKIDDFEDSWEEDGATGKYENQITDPEDDLEKVIMYKLSAMDQRKIMEDLILEINQLQKKISDSIDSIEKEELKKRSFQKKRQKLFDKRREMEKKKMDIEERLEKANEHIKKLTHFEKKLSTMSFKVNN